METITNFKIRNTSNSEIELIHEPECFTFNIPVNDEVDILTNATLDSVILDIGVNKGQIVISILDDKSYYNVLHNGEDVFAKYFD